MVVVAGRDCLRRKEKKIPKAVNGKPVEPSAFVLADAPAEPPGAPETAAGSSSDTDDRLID